MARRLEPKRRQERARYPPRIVPVRGCCDASRGAPVPVLASLEPAAAVAHAHGPAVPAKVAHRRAVRGEEPRERRVASVQRGTEQQCARVESRGYHPRIDPSSLAARPGDDAEDLVPRGPGEQRALTARARRVRTRGGGRVDRVERRRAREASTKRRERRRPGPGVDAVRVRVPADVGHEPTPVGPQDGRGEAGRGVREKPKVRLEPHRRGRPVVVAARGLVEPRG